MSLKLTLGREKKQMFLNDAEETENQWRSEIQQAATANVGFLNLEFERDLIYNWQLEAWIIGFDAEVTMAEVAPDLELMLLRSKEFKRVTGAIQATWYGMMKSKFLTDVYPSI